MHKIIVFDLDGTLCGIGKGMTAEDAASLRAVEELGYRIAICSGKPTYYLCGFMRQIELAAPILIGENGAVTQYGVDLPPSHYSVHPYSNKAKEQIRHMRELIDRECSERVWYQPNEVGLTPFPKDAATFDDIQKLVNDNRDNTSELMVYRHSDSFDLTPKNISKYSALALLSEALGIDRHEFIAVGDGVNDIPMFDYSDISMLIGGRLNYNADLTFDSIKQALEYIISRKP